jgi:uncharacterized small protein (DUF1192 family)
MKEPFDITELLRLQLEKSQKEVKELKRQILFLQQEINRLKGNINQPIK